MHALTGCDTTSAFYGREKKKTFDLVVAAADADITAELRANCELS